MRLQLASSKRKPKRAESAKGKGAVDGSQVRAHVSAATALKQARGKDLEKMAFKTCSKSWRMANAPTVQRCSTKLSRCTISGSAA